MQVFSYDHGQKNLRHAWVDSGYGWRHENFDGTDNSVCGLEGDIGGNPVTLVYNGSLQVFYYDSGGGNLRHAWSDAGGWHCETLEGNGAAALGYESNVGAMPSAVVIGDTLQVFAYQPEYQALRHYWISTGHGWRSENLDGLGGNPSGRLNHELSLDPFITTYGGLQLFYYDHSKGNLRHLIPN